MKIFYRIVLIFILVYFGKLSLFACQVLSFNFNDLACVNTTVLVSASGQKTAGCLDAGIMERIEVIGAPQGSVSPMFVNSDEGEFTFSMPGTYTLRYTFTDDPNCANNDPCVEEKTIEIIRPNARFADDDNRIRVCVGNTFEANIELQGAISAVISDSRILNQGNQLVVNEGSTPGMGVLLFNEPVEENFKLYILQATNSIIQCSSEPNKILDSILVQAIPAPMAVPISAPDCDVTNEFYSMSFKITGGEGNYTLVTQSEAILNGDTLTTNMRPSGESVSITVNTGAVCGDYTFIVQEVCACTVNAGDMPLDIDSYCEDAVTVINHNKENVVSRPIDNILYVLHSNDSDELGDIFEIKTTTDFTLPADSLVDSTLYVSAVIGPYEIEGFDISSSSCYNVSIGTPVVWFSDEDFEILGKDEVCHNEKNAMYEIQYNRPPREPYDADWILGGNGSALFESLNSERAFLTFPEAQDQSTLYFETRFALNDTTTCISLDSLVINSNTTMAPEESNIILWPGNILASTSDGPCYQWGSVNKFGEFAFNIFEGANEKYYYSPENISTSTLEEQSFFVAIFDDPSCNFSFENCNSIIFFNDNLLPGLNYQDQDNFSLSVVPNPTEGNIKLEIEGDFKGIYQGRIFNSAGIQEESFVVNKMYPTAIRSFDLSKYAPGMYFVELVNELGERQIIKTIKI